MLEKPEKRYFTHTKETNIRNIFPLLMFQQLLVNKHHRLRDSKIWPNGGLRLATDINCVIRILAERSLVQPTDKNKKDLLDLITALKKL